MHQEMVLLVRQKNLKRRAFVSREYVIQKEIESLSSKDVFEAFYKDDPLAYMLLKKQSIFGLLLPPI